MDGLLDVSAFIEKPDAGEVDGLIAEGALWHSGIFVASVRTVERELHEHTPEVAALRGVSAPEAVAALAPEVGSISLERGLFERSTELKVLPTDFGWDDVGTWASLRRARELDDAGNGVFGRAWLVDASANVVHTDNGTTVLYGVDDLIVVRLDDITFVTTLERARDLRPLLESLPDELRRRTGK
jgi:mannose-1-phosphate guanylyltransferase